MGDPVAGGPVVIVATAKALPGKSEELGKEFLKLVKATRLEAGTLIYELHRSNSDSDVWLVYEKYESQAAFEAHVAGAPLQKFLGLTPELVQGGVEIKQYVLVGDSE
jgi:quinol monooxygenase YgiN